MVSIVILACVILDLLVKTVVLTSMISPSICQNNGICEDLVDDFICSCPDTYAGKTCERQSFCSPEQDNCRNNDLCNTPSTEGIIDAIFPRQNGGICIETASGTSTMCFCRTGFTDDFCQTIINECFGIECLNGGTCVDGIAT